MVETYIDSGGILNGICYGLCECRVWPIVYDMRGIYSETRYGKCGFCHAELDLLDPHLFDKAGARMVFRERYGKNPL